MDLGIDRHARRGLAYLSRRVLRLSRRSKQLLAIGFDAIACCAATWCSFTLLTGVLHWPTRLEWPLYVVSVAIAVPIFGFSGLYRAVFRHTGMAALTTIVKANIAYGLILGLPFFALESRFPFGTWFLQPLIQVFLIGGSRALVRQLLTAPNGAADRRHYVLIYGAGSAGAQLARALTGSHQFKLVGFLDDEPRLNGVTLNGLPVYQPEQLPQLMDIYSVTDVLLALPSVSRSVRNEILERLRPHSVRVRTVPGLSDIARGQVETSNIRELDVEDLLGRDVVPPDPALLEKAIRGRIVAVTGAGGSIGSEICRQVLDHSPSSILLIEQSEFALYSIHSELVARAAKSGLESEIIPLLADVRNYDQISRIFSMWQPHTVYHAAAYKHVPLVEHNLAQGIRNNVFGTLATAVAASRANVSNFTLISTDKAVRPTNVMGASKRLAELVLQALSSPGRLEIGAINGIKPGRIGNATRFSMVRFGNVLGSSGSVVPLFRRQIKSGGPLTLTHPDVTRYFMTIPEAAQLVMQAGTMARGGDVFLLDMGEPVRIWDLAERMIQLSGLTLRSPDNPAGDIEIEITGLRAGEKLYEELLIGDSPEATEHPRIMKATETSLEWRLLVRELEHLDCHIMNNAAAAIYAALKRLVTGFVATADIVDNLYVAENLKPTAEIRVLPGRAVAAAQPDETYPLVAHPTGT